MHPVAIARLYSARSDSLACNNGVFCPVISISVLFQLNRALDLGHKPAYLS